jgi:CRISPR-associated protein Csd1
MADPDYEPRPVAWIVRVGPKGKLLGLESNQTIPPGSKKPVARTMPVAREPKKTSGDRASYLVDKAEYIFGVDPAGTRDAAKLADRARLFRELVHSVADATKDEAVEAVAAYLAELSSGQPPPSEVHNAAGNDLFAFKYRTETEPVHLRPKVKAYWKQSRTDSAIGASARLGRCLVTGEPISEAVNFPQVKKVPGGQSSGVPLVSFNTSTNPAFGSHGWKDNENALISRSATEAAATALQRLLERKYPDPTQTGQFLPSRRIDLPGDMAWCYWSPVAEQAEAIGLALDGGDLATETPESVAEMVFSVWRGEPAPLAQPAAFYALTISGAEGRMIVRDWIESNVGDVQQNLARHLNDLCIVRNVPVKKGSRLPPTIPLHYLLRSLSPPGRHRGKNVPAHLEARFLRAAIVGGNYPEALLNKAVQRMCAEIARANTDNQQQFFEAMHDRDARVAIVKAVLRRNHNSEVTPDMDYTNTTPAYRLGCMLALAERVQAEALGSKVNATVVDRFYGSASATPAAVYGLIMKRMHINLSKVRKEKPGLAIRLNNICDEIVGPVRAIPKHLAIAEQGLFVLGYHHMRHWLWMNSEDRKKWEAAHLDAPKSMQWSKEPDNDDQPTE